MSDLIREAALGQVIRLFTKNKSLRYPEEDPNFKIPWEEVALGEKEKELEADSDGLTPPAANHDPELANVSHTISLAMIPTAASSGRMQPTASRILSREQTLPYSAQRFEVEREEDEMRTTSTIIQPQKTADGITLVDWYYSDDPANPQNWSSWKKAYVGLLIFLYTFAVYAGSAIYTSSEPGVMEQFGVGQSKASLGLSMQVVFLCLSLHLLMCFRYVIGYGLGPMIFSPMSEIPLFGRNLPYISSFALFTILSVPTALVNNYAGLLVLRFLTGFMGSPCLATGGATMQDLYSLLKLPYALTAWVAGRIYVLSPRRTLLTNFSSGLLCASTRAFVIRLCSHG